MSLIDLTGQLVNGLVISVFYALTALGLSRIFGVLRIVNFAHGELYMMGGFAYYVVASLLGVLPAAAVLVASAGVFLLGAVLERLLIRPVYEGTVDRPAGVLSGGQQRLLELERALMSDPQLLLVDEPTVALDPKTAHVIYEHLRDLVAREGRTVLEVPRDDCRVADLRGRAVTGSNRQRGRTRRRVPACVRQYGLSVTNGQVEIADMVVMIPRFPTIRI